MRPWRKEDIKDHLEYRIGLCQDKEGKRYHKLVSAQDIEASRSNPELFWITRIISNELLKKRNFIEICHTSTLEDGRMYEIDVHGIWFTLEEWDQFFVKRLDWEEIMWSTPIAPNLPPM
ncbi:hypothetical protein [Deinococcus yunweiensis]|uniref:hypothetical protein n=1 Tax=Deinococcus yunweiensis TaxID=367282 RepID=UPI00398ED7B6